jgi:hypothetical protein
MAIIPLTAKTPASSRTTLLDKILSCTDYYVKLFTNEVDENNPEFTEASFLGYDQVKLDKDNWNASVIESGLAVSYYKYPVFWVSKNILNVVIYGYYVVDDSNTVIWYQKFLPVILSKDKGLNIVPKIILGCVPTPTPEPISSRTFYGSYFRIKYSSTALDEESFVFRLNDNYKINIAREAISQNILNVYVVGKIVFGEESYNSPWTFHLNPDTIELVVSEVPPNENYNLSPASIAEGLANRTFKGEVCYDFLTSSVTEMELKGVVYCGDSLMWKSRNQKDSETNEFIQFGYCYGNCPEDSGKVFGDLTDFCSETYDNPNRYDRYILDRDDAFNRIDQYTENEYVPDIDAILAWTAEEQANFDYLGSIAEELDIDNQLEEYRNRNPTPTQTPTGGL